MTSPELGAGNWFANYPTTLVKFDSINQPNFPGHVEDVYKKYYYMNSIKGIDLPGKATSQIELSFDPDDKLYKGTCQPLMRPGIYKVKVLATHEPDKNSIPFRRDVHLAYNIKVKPNLDWSVSSLRFKKMNPNESMNNNGDEFDGQSIDEIQKREEPTESSSYDRYRLKFTPKDKYENFVKPGKSENIKFHLKNATLSKLSIYDDLEGSYYQDIYVPQNTIKPTVIVQFRDFLFEKKVITDNPKSDNWRIYPNALSFHAGAVHPYNNTNSLNKYGSTNFIDFLHQVNKKWAVNIIMGYFQFEPKKPNTENLEFWNLSLNLRWFPIVLLNCRVFLNAGGGYYKKHDSSNDYAGDNIGFGFNIPISTRMDIELGSNYYHLYNQTDEFSFTQAFGGVLIRF